MKNYFKAYRERNPAIHERVFFEDTNRIEAEDAFNELLEKVRELTPNASVAVQYSVFRPYKWQPQTLRAVGETGGLLS